ncbi:MAG TPA: peptidoglycan recognition family protein [Actinomycetota bacterium]|nr:peptidoglycan recognition family protein [Actinomycetota bacterium]
MRILPRSAWGAEPPRGPLRRHRIERVIVHESGHVVRDERDTLANLPAYQADHLARGWSDLAYHFVIDARGNVYRGRRPSTVGDTATDYDPRGSLLVMCDGAFRWQRPGAEQVRALIHLLAWAQDTYGVAPQDIATHRDVAPIACPGARLHGLFADGSIGRRVVRTRLV